MGFKTTRFIERNIGPLACSILSLFKRRPMAYASLYRGHHPETILIIQLWSIGETILTFPAMQAVRKKYPNTKITVLCTKSNEAMFNGQKFYDTLEVLDLGIKSLLKFIRTKRYDMVIDMEEHYNVSAIISFLIGKYSIGYSHGSRGKLYSKVVDYNDQQHVVQTFCDLIGTKAPNKLLPLLYEDCDKCLGNMLLSKRKIKKFIGICVTSGGTATSRRWPYFKELIEEITKKRDVIIFGSPKENLEEYKVNNRVHLFQGNISESIYLIRYSQAFISSDTGPMHIAAAQGVKTIGIFGPNLPIRFGPYGKGNVALYRPNCNKSPCINVHKGAMPECKNAVCMQSISVHEVLEHIFKET